MVNLKLFGMHNNMKPLIGTNQLLFAHPYNIEYWLGAVCDRSRQKTMIPMLRWAMVWVAVLGWIRDVFTQIIIIIKTNKTLLEGYTEPQRRQGRGR